MNRVLGRRVAALAGLVAGIAMLAGCGAPVAEPPTLAGHLIVLARDVKRAVDTAVRVAVESGQMERLWEVPGRVVAWEVSPGGDRAAYVVSKPDDGSAELVLRSLTPDAPPQVLATAPAGEAQLLGIKWSADGRRLAYGRSEGVLNVLDPDKPIPPKGWELHVVALDATPRDEVIWRLPSAEVAALLYRLEAWDSRAERALVSLRGGKDRTVQRLLRIDTSAGRQVDAVDVETQPYPELASADGRWLAVPETDVRPEAQNQVRRMAVAAGEPSEIMMMEAGIQPAWPLWSADAAQLAFLEVGNLSMPPDEPMQTRAAATEVAATAITAGSPPPPETLPTLTPVPPVLTRVRVVQASGGATVLLAPTRNTGERPAAFSPDGRLLAVTVVNPRRPTAGAAVDLYDLLSDTAAPVRRIPVPPGSSYFDWLP